MPARQSYCFEACLKKTRKLNLSRGKNLRGKSLLPRYRKEFESYSGKQFNSSEGFRSPRKPALVKQLFRGKIVVALSLVSLLTFLGVPPESSTASETPVDLADEPVASVPSLWISKTTNLNPLGEEVTVIGRGFVDGDNRKATRPPLRPNFGGAYIVFGKFQDTWKPSAGAPSSSRTVSQQRWAVLPEFVSTIGGPSAGAVAINPNGTFETTLTVRAEFDGMPQTGNIGIFAFGGGGAVVPEFEFENFLTFTPSKVPFMAFATSPVEPQPDQPFALSVLVNPSDAAGTLTLSGRGLSSQTVRLQDGRAGFNIPALVGGRYVWDISFTPDEPLLFTPSTQGFAISLGENVLPELQMASSSGAGFLSWGVKTSFRQYVTGPIAKGSIDLSGAGRTGSQFVFGQAQEVIDLSPGTQVNYRGAVRFLGHSGVLNVGMANPRVTITSESSAVLSVEVNGQRRDMASLQLSRGTKSVSDGVTTFSNVPATLLASGQSVFSFQGSAFYQAGEALDTVTFSVGASAEVIEDNYVFESFATEDVDEELIEELDFAVGVANTHPCTVADATLTWGFKESFRAYLSGTIAKGSWTAFDGATYDVPNFSFPHQSGSYNPESSQADIMFAGTVVFTGHEGVLNSTVSNPRLVATSDTSATLFVDISGETMDGVTVSETAVSFANVDLGLATVTRDGMTVTIADAPATLTRDGARAFGTYPAGEELDPITVVMLSTLDCAVGGSDSVWSAGELDTSTAGLSWSTAGLIGAGSLATGLLGGFLLRRQDWFGVVSAFTRQP